MSKRIIRSVVVVLFFCMCLNNLSTPSYAEEVQPELVAGAQEQLVADPNLIQNQVTVAEAETVPTAADQLTLEQQQTEAALNEAIAQVAAVQQTRQLVFIGDSRTVGMKSAVGKNNNIWSAKVGMGLSWMKSTGVPAVESDINANTDVVILMGVNDVRNLSYTSKYISYINEKAAAWTALGANVYYVSVNPMVYETKNYPGINNTLISNWNSLMQEGLSENVNYIDTFSQVEGQLYSRDGIHYNNKSYKLIYSLINQSIINDKAIKALYQG